jgi:hypothetical protein
MAVSSSSPFAERSADVSTTPPSSAIDEKTNSDALENTSCALPPKSSIDTSIPPSTHETESPTDFTGDLNTNNEIPTQEALKNIEDFTVLDRDGKLVLFKSIYTGSNVARRVLVIFIRHFFCGVCPSPFP